MLGCTHYPLLAGLLGLVMGDEVTLVSSADETAKDVYRILDRAGPAASAVRRRSPVPRHRFLATGDAAPFARLASRFLGPAAANVGTLAKAAGRETHVEPMGARSETP